MAMDQLALSVQQAAEMVSISETKMRELLLSGEIASKKVGKRRIVPRWALEQWLDETESTEDRAAWLFKD